MSEIHELVGKHLTLIEHQGSLITLNTRDGIEFILDDVESLEIKKRTQHEEAVKEKSQNEITEPFGKICSIMIEDPTPLSGLLYIIKTELYYVTIFTS